MNHSCRQEVRSLSVPPAHRNATLVVLNEDFRACVTKTFYPWVVTAKLLTRLGVSQEIRQRISLTGSIHRFTVYYWSWTGISRTLSRTMISRWFQTRCLSVELSEQYRAV